MTRDTIEAYVHNMLVELKVGINNQTDLERGFARMASQRPTQSLQVYFWSQLGEVYLLMKDKFGLKSTHKRYTSSNI